ncbi:hypothetical protein L917_02708, partial [Phytophthora nicotianae]
SEPFDWINDTDIDDLYEAVATFVRTVTTSSSADISSNDIESVHNNFESYRRTFITLK